MNIDLSYAHLRCNGKDARGEARQGADRTRVRRAAVRFRRPKLLVLLVYLAAVQLGKTTSLPSRRKKRRRSTTVYHFITRNNVNQTTNRSVHRFMV